MLTRPGAGQHGIQAHDVPLQTNLCLRDATAYIFGRYNDHGFSILNTTLLGGRQPLCGTGVTSEMLVIFETQCIQRATADSRPWSRQFLTSRF